MPAAEAAVKVLTAEAAVEALTRVGAEVVAAVPVMARLEEASTMPTRMFITAARVLMPATATTPVTMV
jgi:hypothetical protein